MTQEGKKLPDIPPSHDRDLPPGRHRVLREHLMREIENAAESAENSHSPAADDTAVRRRFWRRPAFVAPAVAATLTTAVVVGATLTQNAAAPPRPATANSGQPNTQSAAELLERIAKAAEERDLPQVRDDQFVYSKQEQYHWKADPATSWPDNCPTTAEGHGFGVYETWESVDGQQSGLSRHKENGKAVERQIAEQLPGKNWPNYYRQTEELPTDPEEMHRWLYGLEPGEQPSGMRSADRDAFNKAERLLIQHLLPPEVEAALYRAVARIPGLTVHAADTAGRTGVAVTMEGEWHGDFGQGATRHEMLFSEKDLEFMGLNVVDLKGSDARCNILEAGDLVSSVAILDRGVVDGTGRLP